MREMFIDDDGRFCIKQDGVTVRYSRDLLERKLKEVEAMAEMYREWLHLLTPRALDCANAAEIEVTCPSCFRVFDVPVPNTHSQ